MVRQKARARSPEDQEKVRRRFIECARAVFAEEGAHGLTMRRLAAAAGYSPGTIYLYFPSRKDLLREVWKEDLLALRDHLNAAILAAPVTDRYGRLRALLHAYAGFWFDRPDHFKALFLEVERQYASERAAFADDDSVRAVHTLLLHETTAALGNGDAAAPETEARDPRILLLTHSLLASVHGVVTFHIANPGFRWADRDAMVETVVSAMIAGLRG